MLFIPNMNQAGLSVWFALGLAVIALVSVEQLYRFAAENDRVHLDLFDSISIERKLRIVKIYLRVCQFWYSRISTKSEDEGLRQLVRIQIDDSRRDRHSVALGLQRHLIRLCRAIQVAFPVRNGVEGPAFSHFFGHGHGACG